MLDVVVFAGPFTDVNSAIEQNFDDFVDDIVVALRHIQRSVEQNALDFRPNRRDDYDKPVMNAEFGVLSEEVLTIVRNDRVVVFDRERDQVVVLPARLSDVGHVMRKESAHLGRGNQGTTQALVDEKLDGQSGIRAAGMLRQSGPYVSCAHRITASIPSTGKLG
jgi:hypothetical protein